MKTSLAAAVLLVVLAPGLAACGGDDGPTTAQDPAGSQPSAAVPTAVPAAPGAVRARSLPTVMDTGAGPELCLGAIAESYPPQCGGPAVVGWDWRDQAPDFEQQGDVRWGTFAVTGTWDGTTFTVTEAVPGALYDPAPEEPVELPTPGRAYSPAELEEIATEVGEVLPGAQGAYADQEGHVLVDVTYDDGSLQDYADARWGAGVVVVGGALVDA
jgi:hypothetical protein